MATTYYYVGPGGDNGNSGLTYELRFLDFGGVFDKGLVAGDFYYIAPGTYRGSGYFTFVNGTLADPIVFYGDVTGEHTDGIGGMVRCARETTDTSEPVEPAPFFNTLGEYRHFYNITFDMTLSASGSLGPIRFAPGYVRGGLVDGCVFGNVNEWNSTSWGGVDIVYDGADGVAENNTIVRNCIIFASGRAQGLLVQESPLTYGNLGFVFENNIIWGADVGIYTYSGYGIIQRNNTYMYCRRGAYLAGDTGEDDYFYQNMFLECDDDVIDFNGNIVSDHNVSYNSSELGGTNHINAPPYFDMPLLLQGFKFPNFNFIFGLNDRTAVTKNTSLNAPATDVQGLTRPTGTAKKTPGAIQYRQPTRETTVVHRGTSSMKLPDASRVIYLVQLSGETPHTFSVGVYRDADYAGTLPQMVIKRVGQSDITVTDTGSAEQWNTLGHTFTPDAGDRFAQIEFVSNNTATSGDYAAYIDSFRVKSKDYRTKAFMSDLVHIENFNKRPLDDVWITLSTVILSPTIETFDSHLPPYLN